MDSQGQEVACSPGLAANQPEHFVVTLETDNQLSVKLTLDHLTLLGQADPTTLTALKQAFNNMHTTL